MEQTRLRTASVDSEKSVCLVSSACSCASSTDFSRVPQSPHLSDTPAIVTPAAIAVAGMILRRSREAYIRWFGFGFGVWEYWVRFVYPSLGKEPIRAFLVYMMKLIHTRLDPDHFLNFVSSPSHLPIIQYASQNDEINEIKLILLTSCISNLI